MSDQVDLEGLDAATNTAAAQLWNVPAAQLTTGRGVAAAHRFVRSHVSHLAEDRILSDDIRLIASKIEGDTISRVEHKLVISGGSIVGVATGALRQATSRTSAQNRYMPPTVARIISAG